MFVVLTFSSGVYAQNFPQTKWVDSADTTWYDSSQNSFDISDASSFAGLAVMVSHGNDFEGKTINITADIDLSGNLWLPVGTDIAHSFKGDVNGQGHTISNVMVNRPNKDFSGLFGSVISMHIKDLKIDSAVVYGNSTVGALVANLSTNSTAVNCHVTNGYVHCEDGMYGGIAGGLVGGLLTNSSISQSSFSGEVHGGDQLGGLVGTTWDSTLVEESYSAGLVSGGNIVGGLIGYTTMNFPPDPNVHNVVKNCYSRADVIASGSYAGGLFAFPETTGVIKNCYSTGTVSAAGNFGGSIGAIQGASSVSNTYFDTESSGLANGIGLNNSSLNVDITGKTTAEMKTQALVDSLNVNQGNIWNIDPAINDGYPFLVGNTLAVEKWSVKKIAVMLYPTVSNTLVNFKVKEKTHFTIMNLSGRILDQGVISKGSFAYNISQLTSGMYMVIFKQGRHKVTKRFIKK